MKYEIEHIKLDDHQFWESLICTITGLEVDEVTKALKGKQKLRGQEVIAIIRDFGFNTSKWIKFDKQTEYPCIIRARQLRKKQSGWYAYVYYDGFIYDQQMKMGWTRWNHDYPNLKITSMLQVWI